MGGHSVKQRWWANCDDADTCCNFFVKCVGLLMGVNSLLRRNSGTVQRRLDYYGSVHNIIVELHYIAGGESVFNSCHDVGPRPCRRRRSRPDPERSTDRWLAICITLTSPAAGPSQATPACPGRAWLLWADLAAGRPAGRLLWWEKAAEKQGRGWGDRGWPARPFTHRRIDRARKSLRSRNRCRFARRPEQRRENRGDLHTDAHMWQTSPLSVAQRCVFITRTKMA